ncbi:MAG: PAS domain-containing sensor histidine kinase [Rhizobiales bacterium]|nr:PAS domain-containing sensor histidine kinase [Hyphomicrobiales bacterium]
MAGEKKQIEKLKARIGELELAVEKAGLESGKLARRTEDFAAQTDCWFWETDANHVFKYLSDNLERVAVGLSRDDFINKSRLEIITASESEEKASHIDSLLFQRPFRNFHYSLKNTKGEIRHIVSSGWPTTNQHGGFMGYRGTARDVTAEVVEHQTRLDRERGFKVTIEKQAEEFRAIIEHLNQSIMWFDALGGLRLTNSRVASINRFTDEQVARLESLDDYAQLLAERGDFGDGDPTELAKAHTTLLRDELKQTKSVIVRLKSQRLHLRTRYAELPDGGFIISQVDITEEISTEQALQEALKLVEEANQVLEERVEERTHELRELQAKLVQDERDATMNRLIAKISHELRNPLNGLKASMYLIRSKVGEDPRLDKAFGRSERTIKRCEMILTDLYDYAMTRQLKIEPLDVGEWAQMQIEQLRLPEGVTLEVTNLARGLYCEFDEKVLTKAIWKILSNAMHAVTTDAPDLVEKRMYFTVKQDGDRVEFVIQDNGHGMTDEAAQRANEPLFSTRGFGVGLGIPFAEQSFLQHGGGMKLKTAEGRGTTVTLWLPVPRRTGEEQAA